MEYGNNLFRTQIMFCALILFSFVSYCPPVVLRYNVVGNNDEG